MKKFILFTTLLLLLTVSVVGVSAQSEIQFVVFVCENQVIFDVSGTMGANYDVYYQVFRGTTTGGEALTTLRRVPVSGDFAVSDRVPFASGTILAFGEIATAYIAIARETDATNTLFETTASDQQDGCVEPSNPIVGSAAAAASGQQAVGEEILSHSGIFTPDGGFLNPVRRIVTTGDEPVVQIGARQSDIVEPQEIGRSGNPGLLFAECDAFDGAEPGVLYDTDTIVVFWSWFARTQQQVRDHIAHAQYAVTLNGQPFQFVDVSPITLRDGNYWVFYVANLGGAWRPGQYGVSYRLTWDAPISDGYDDFGPGTGNEQLLGSCTFEIQQNPFGVAVVHQNPSIPLQSNR